MTQVNTEELQYIERTVADSEGVWNGGNGISGWTKATTSPSFPLTSFSFNRYMTLQHHVYVCDNLSTMLVPETLRKWPLTLRQSLPLINENGYVYTQRQRSRGDTRRRMTEDVEGSSDLSATYTYPRPQRYEWAYSMVHSSTPYSSVVEIRHSTSPQILNNIHQWILYSHERISCSFTCFTNISTTLKKLLYKDQCLL